TAHATRRETAGDPGSTRPGPAPLRLAPAAAAPRPAPRGLLRGCRPGRPGGGGLGEHVPLARPPPLGSSLLAVLPGLDGAVRHHRALRLARAASPPPGGGQEGDGVLGPAARVEPGRAAAVLRRRPGRPGVPGPLPAAGRARRHDAAVPPPQPGGRAPARAVRAVGAV